MRKKKHLDISYKHTVSMINLLCQIFKKILFAEFNQKNLGVQRTTVFAYFHITVI